MDRSAYDRFQPPDDMVTGLHDDAFGEGEDARNSGGTLTENPYPKGSTLARSWEAGWVDADQTIISADGRRDET